MKTVVLRISFRIQRKTLERLLFSLIFLILVRAQVVDVGADHVGGGGGWRSLMF